jgi:hypothetical protein
MYDDFLARILEPDIFLPSQFYGNGALSRQLEGEKRLMIAILKDAVECLEKHRGSRSGAGKISYQSAIDWVEDTDTDCCIRLPIFAICWDSIPVSPRTTAQAETVMSNRSDGEPCRWHRCSASATPINLAFTVS